jgi:hypothetical protein
LKRRRKRHPVEDKTYRTEPGRLTYWSQTQKLLGRKVVVYMSDQREQPWKGGWLTALVPDDDLFRVKWTRKGFGRDLRGIWRVHPASLFTGTNLLPIPRYPARLPQSTPIKRSREDHMATSSKKSVAKTAAKKSVSKKAAATVDTNGSKTTTERVRGTDKLAGLSEAKRRNIARLITKERAKSPATSWPDITEMVQDKYDWSLPGSMTGRRLMRDYGPDGAEEAIIKQDRTGAKKATAKKVAAKKGASKKKVQEVEEPEDLEELEEDEELEEEEDLEDEDEEEMEADEDEDEEEDEEEEEEPEPVKAKKVRVTKGRTRKANPSR